VFRFVVFSEEREGQLPPDGGEAQAEDDDDAQGGCEVLLPAKMAQGGEDGGAGGSRRRVQVDLASEDQWDLAHEDVAQRPAGDAGHHAHGDDDEEGLAEVVGGQDGDGLAGTENGEEGEAGGVRGLEDGLRKGEPSCREEGEHSRHHDRVEVAGIADPEHGQVPEDHVTEGAATEGGDDGEDDDSEEIDLAPGRRQDAGDGAAGDRDVFDPVEHRRSEQPLGPSDPGLVTGALELGGKLVVLDEFADEGTGGFDLAAGMEQFGVLDLGSGVPVVLEDLLPGGHGGVDFAEGGLGFREGHLGVAVIVAGVRGEGLFEQGLGFRRALEPEQALAEVRDGVGVVWVALQRFPVTDLGLGELAEGEIVVGEVQMVAGVVEMVDPVLDLLQPCACACARKFETDGAATGRSLLPVDEEEVEDGG
jgi:hypothetical protein